MIIINEGLCMLLCGILAITTIDVAGSITSRKWNYNYVYLTPISFLVYTSLGYFGYKYSGNLTWTMIVTAIVGIYDGTIGWKISTVLNANFGKFKESNSKLSLSDRIIGMITISAIFAFIGYSLAGWSV